MDDKEDIYKVDDEDDYEEKNDDKENIKKKYIKYGIIAFVCLIVFILLIALLFPGGKKKNSEENIKEITLISGDEYALDYSKGTFSWTSSDQTVAKVSNDGKIVALKNGDTTITIKVGSDTVTYKVHVDKVDDSVIVTNVKMEKNTIELEKNKTYDMKVSFTPKDATNVELTWTSSNEKIATVKDGVITAVAPGTCIITVKTTNGNIDNCLVKVLGDGKYNPVESISIDSTDVSLNKGTSYNLSYEVVPSDSINLVTWESSNNEIATVENGIIYALAGGEIEVTAKSGDISKTVKVKVNAEKQEPKFVLNQNNIGLGIGDSYTLSINNDTPVSWNSEDNNIAVVDQNGKVTAKSEGITKIIAKSADGYFDECIVSVSQYSSSEKISLNTNTLSLNINDKVKLIETVTPSNNVSNVTWSSSDTNVATVNNGEVIAINNGTATITASLPNGSSAECVVNVSSKIVKAAMVQINASNITLTVGKTNQLSAKVLPSNTTNKTITWSSSNNDIATVDQNGIVTAKKQGSAKIYAKSANGVFDTCAVIVK